MTTEHTEELRSALAWWNSQGSAEWEKSRKLVARINPAYRDNPFERAKIYIVSCLVLAQMGVALLFFALHFSSMHDMVRVTVSAGQSFTFFVFLFPAGIAGVISPFLLYWSWRMGRSWLWLKKMLGRVDVSENTCDPERTRFLLKAYRKRRM